MGTPLCETMAAQGLLDSEQLEEATERAEKQGEHLGLFLIRAGLASVEDVAQALAIEADAPYVAPELLVFDPQRLESMPRKLLERHGVIPVAGHGDNAFAAEVPPPMPAVLDLESFSGRRMQTVITHVGIIV